MRAFDSSLSSFPVGAIVLASLTACGGGGTSAPSVPPPPVVSPTSLSGTVAVGAPITSGLLRVLDADGIVVAHDVAVAADGRYADVALTGRGPWRLEACGYAGANWRCIYAVAQAAGTANVTPLTSALITLASGRSPESIMEDGAGAPDTARLAAAQARLASGLAGTLADAGVGESFDFTTGSLAAGTRSGYDRVLDAVAVTTGTDDGAFVQVSPRLGDGNLYLTAGSTTGAITSAAGAAALPLGGLETLFAKMSAAMASAAACADANTGLFAVVAADARMAMGGGGLMTGRADVAAGMCQFFGSGDRGSSPMWGSRLVSPTLGRCDFTRADPVCAVSFALQGPDGGVQNVGGGIGVVYRDASWQFYGDLLPIQIHANAAVQRGRRVDDASTPDQFMRALQFDVLVTPGVQCVQVSQRDAAGSPATIAYYKVHSADASRMSLWTANNGGNSPSLDPTAGATRSTDDSWVGLPDGTAGDEVVRNFYRGGRSVTMSIYADAACATPATVDGRSDFTIDVDGVPPVWSEMQNLAWGELSDTSTTALEALALDGGHGGALDAAWSFAGGVTGFDQATLCTSGSCAEGSAVRLADMAIRPNARTAALTLNAPASALRAGDFKMFILGGRDGAGMNIESSFFSCTGAATGQMCRQ